MMNGLDSSSEALIEYVRACKIRDPEQWLNDHIPRWREPPKEANNVCDNVETD